MYFGRKEIEQQLQDLCGKRVSSFVTCRGRRRIGKSTLIEHFAGSIRARFLKIEGVKPKPGYDNETELAAFARQLSLLTEAEDSIPANWLTAFKRLDRELAFECDIMCDMKNINTSLFDFPRLRSPKADYVYVDKTAQLYEIAKPTADCIYYLPRPRRFGKSLMLSTLKALFEKGCHGMTHASLRGWTDAGKSSCMLVVAFVAMSAVTDGVAQPVIDDTPTRVQTTLRVPFRPVGTLRPKAVGQVSTSRWTVDCAGMDREHVDWRAIREYVAPLGIARMRQQAGWARCEREPGSYDFAWLDQAVFDAKAMGIDTWLEFSYGNPIYPGGGGRQLSGGFPSSDEALAAWDRWVEATVTHYKGVVKDFCVWNEPDLNRKHDPMVATRFAIRTAEIVKRIEPEARIDAFALCTANRRFVESFVMELARLGKTDLFTAVAYHHYADNPDGGYALVESCKKVIARHAPNLKMKEGEGGTQSEWCRTGALSGIHWSELTQAKYNLRRALGDLGHGDDTEVFHLCDLEYRTSNFHDGLVRYGLLKTAGQAKAYRIYKVKMSYYAVQNAVSVFNDALTCLDYGTTSTVSDADRTYVCDWTDRKAGTPLVVFWDKSGRPSDENVTRTVELRVKSAPFEEPVWVDVLTGNAYAIPADRIRRDGAGTVYTVPCYDSPAFVTDRRILDLDASWFVCAGSPEVVTTVPAGMRPFARATAYGPVDVTGRPFLPSASEIRAVCGEGRELAAVNARFQLMRSGVLDSGLETGQYVVLSLWSRQAQSVTFCWRNDYYGTLAVNGAVVEKALKGPVQTWGTKSVELKEGENEIVFRTTPGSSGEWFFDAGVVDTTGELKLR